MRLYGGGFGDLGLDDVTDITLTDIEVVSVTVNTSSVVSPKAPPSKTVDTDFEETLDIDVMPTEDSPVE